MDKETEFWSWNETKDGDWFHGLFDTREDAIEDALNYHTYLNKNSSSKSYLGKCKIIPLRTDVDVERVLEYLDEAYCDDSGCDYYIYESVTDEQFAWLENKFSEVMDEFHKMANINPGWFEISDIEEIDLKDYVKEI